MQDSYIPGACNIGKSEIKKRELLGWFGLIASIILYVLFTFLELPRFWRLVLFIPSTMAAIGFLQAKMHFCAYFGMVGLFNFGEKVGRTDTVEKAQFRAMDRRRAWQIIAYSTMIGIVVAVLAYYFPF